MHEFISQDGEGRDSTEEGRDCEGELGMKYDCLRGKVVQVIN